MNILVCVKRVPAPGARITLTPDARDIDTRHLAFTVSPHEECAVEEAVRLVSKHGGEATVLTLGPPEAEEQLRNALAIGADAAVLLETDGVERDPQATAAGIVDTVRTLEAEAGDFDLVIFGNESADAGNYQVGIRVAHALSRPVVAGVKGLEIGLGPTGAPSSVSLQRRTDEGYEHYELPLPAVLAVEEGINVPRYPALKGRVRAKKIPVRRADAPQPTGALRTVGLRQPAEQDAETVVLGRGGDAAPAAADLLERLGVI